MNNQKVIHPVRVGVTSFRIRIMVKVIVSEW